jgi:uncharacterized protein (DUF1810 family)
MRRVPAAHDSFDLNRFVEAQSGGYEQVLTELRRGRKRGHWIWYILPQMRGLGLSSMSSRYGIRSLDEAKAYVAHPVLGPRLRDCVEAVGTHKGLSATQVFGSLDAMKFRSCLTLFAEAEGPDSVFARALGQFFDDQRDPRTLELLGRVRGGGDDG